MSLPEKNDYDSLGGEKIDYSPVADPETDLSAEELNETRCDVAAMTQTAIRAWCSFTVTATVPAIGNTEQDYGAVYGRATSYKPSIVRDFIGTFTITFPTSVVDSRGNTKSLNIQCCFGCAEELDECIIVKRLSANTIKVQLTNVVTQAISDPVGRVNVFIL